MKKIIATATLVLALASCSNDNAGGPVNETDSATSGGTYSSCQTRSYEEIGGPFSLVDQNGDRRTEEDFKGKPALVFFGFTYCPDVCPLTLVKVDRALQRLDEDKRPVTILITVDPERDTPEALSKYLSLDAYPENTVGLTGTEEEISDVVRGEFFGYYSKVPLPDSAAEYTMDHSSLLYLMDENWKLKTLFDYTDTAEDIATCLEQLL